MTSNISQTDIADAVIQALKLLAGGKAPEEIEENMDVLKEWDLDSEDGVDLASDLGPSLGIEIPLKDNPLIEEDGTGRKRARSFREVVQYLSELEKTDQPETKE